MRIAVEHVVTLKLDFRLGLWGEVTVGHRYSSPRLEDDHSVGRVGMHSEVLWAALVPDCHFTPEGVNPFPSEPHLWEFR